MSLGPVYVSQKERRKILPWVEYFWKQDFMGRSDFIQI